MRVAKIISGGQTGADRGGLDAARALGLDRGGWCPRGRLAEDGRVPREYAMTETDSVDYLHRTSLNVIAAHATIIFSYGGTTPEKGSKLTRDLCVASSRPYLVIVLKRYASDDDAVRACFDFLAGLPGDAGVINIAGNRESSARIHRRVADIVRRAVDAVNGGEPFWSSMSSSMLADIDAAAERVARHDPIEVIGSGD